MSIIIFIVILGILIFSHELGHFLAAKKVGARVDEFGLGFPPRVWGVKRGETIYSINWLPFGGFVKIFGENPEEGSADVRPVQDESRSLAHKPKYQQAIVLVAGVTFNVLLAWLLIAIGFATVGLPTSEGEIGDKYPIQNPALMITAVLPHSPADAAGLKAGDKILSIGSDDGVEILNEPSANQVREFIANSPKEIALEIARGTEVIQIVSKPVAGLIADEPGKQAIGVGLERVGLLRLPLPAAIGEGGRATVNMVVSTALNFWELLTQAFRGERTLLTQVAGPVGLAGLVGDASRLGFGYLLNFMALISINLAILNLIPFPALDGGRLLFLLIEKVKGSPITPKVANAFNVVGFALLIILMLAVTYQDIVRLMG